MKKIIFIAVCSLIIATSVQAQEVAVKSPSLDLKVEYKRCITTNNVAFIDVLITNTSGQDTKIRYNGISIYDDEGNVYNNDNLPYGQHIIKLTTGNTNREPLNSIIVLPAGISYKARIAITGGFDKYATMIKLLKINFSWDVFSTKVYGQWIGGEFELRNLPIVRE